MDRSTRWALSTLSALFLANLALGQGATSPGTPSPQASANQAAAAVSRTVPAAPIAAALELYRFGKLAEAEAAYNEILKSDPKSGAALAGLIRVQLKQNRIADADGNLSRALAVSPDSDDVQTARGEVYFREARIPEAEQVFTTLVRKGPTPARAYLGLGKIYWATSTYQHAKLQFDRAHEADPDDPDIRRRWMATLTRKERIQALKGYLSGESDDDADEREHLQTGLAALEDSESTGKAACQVVNAPPEVHVKMEQLMYDAKRIRGYGLRVEVNGSKGNLLLDTGASGLLISQKLADKAGVKAIVKTDIHGIGDKEDVKAYIGLAESFRIGNLEFKGCHVEVSERKSVTDEDGLIGADVFSRYLVTINFPDKTLDLTALPEMPPLSEAEKALSQKFPDTSRFRDRFVAPEMKNYNSVYRFGHMLLIPTRINDSKPKLFLIDTGAFSDTISPEAAREVTRVRSADEIKVKGINGDVNRVFTAAEVTLAFSHFRQPARDMVAFDTSHISRNVGTEISGTLGFNMLYQMTLKIDYRDGLVDFGYDPKRPH